MCVETDEKKTIQNCRVVAIDKITVWAGGHTFLLFLELLLVAGLADVHADLVTGRYRPLKVHAEAQVITVRGELPEQAGAVLVSWHPHLGRTRHTGRLL